MPFWRFKKSEREQLTPTELRDKLIETAALGAGRKLGSLCKQYKTQVAEHVDVICKIPEGMPMPWKSTTKQVKLIRTTPILSTKAGCACLNLVPTPRQEKRLRRLNDLRPAGFAVDLIVGFPMVWTKERSRTRNSCLSELWTMVDWTPLKLVPSLVIALRWF